MEIIQYLNSNNGLIVTLLTFLLVATTIYYSIITRSILKINKKTHLESTRPYVIASFDSFDSGIEFKIKNYGITAAYNTRIIIDPPLDSIDMLLNEKLKQHFEHGHRPMLNQEILPPNFEIKTTLQFSQSFVENEKLNRKFKFKIKYQDYDGTEFLTEYFIDLSTIIFKDKIMSFSDGYYLNEINKSLKKIIKINKR